MDDSTSRRLNSLAFALEMMGFDTERLAEAIAAPVDHYVKFVSLRSIRVEFDRQRAIAVQPHLSPVAEAAAESWFLDVRRPDISTVAPHGMPATADEPTEGTGP